MLKVFIEDGRREYEARFVTHTKAPPPPSDSMRLGSLAHAMILEPDKVVEGYAVIPNDVLSVSGTRAGAKWKEFEAANAGKTLMKASEYRDVCDMIDSVAKKCGPWFAGAIGKAEYEIRWTDKHSGLPCKARIDFLVPRFTLDFKTAKSSSPKAFRGAVKIYRYDIQEAHYTNGVEETTGETTDFLFVVVKSESPFQCRVYRTPEFENVPDWRRIDKSWGRLCRQEAMLQLAKCYETGDFSDPFENDVMVLYEEDCR